MLLVVVETVHHHSQVFPAIGMTKVFREVAIFEAYLLQGSDFVLVERERYGVS